MNFHLTSAAVRVLCVMSLHMVPTKIGTQQSISKWKNGNARGATSRGHHLTASSFCYRLAVVMKNVTTPPTFVTQDW